MPRNLAYTSTTARGRRSTSSEAILWTWRIRDELAGSGAGAAVVTGRRRPARLPLTQTSHALTPAYSLGDTANADRLDTTFAADYPTAVIPPFDPSGDLPPGIHWADWQEISARFGWSEHRRRLLDGLGRGSDALRQAGCSTVYIDGSFVTAAEAPNDFDACWDTQGVDPGRLDPILLAFGSQRAAQKIKYLGEFLPAQAAVDLVGTVVLDFFQVNKYTGDPKGIVALDIRGA
jgi:hypothetical protein